ncbi:NAD(P)-binding protein [Leucosporidium creatinivorum]|uniref:NAD(P)-binding protein n=1 Tax=Leucosporidium creatinivorum TaxID=106004 RepID=A0A1Y2FG14_9BASI|nr:NAD(P)-binding protein [Leucosporidium creatinivorum]
MVATHIFFLGANGYVGGPVASRLVDLGYRLTALVRKDDSRAAALRARGVEVVIGDLDSTDLIRERAASSHAVFACASNSHLPSTVAILEGFEQRYKKEGKVGILVQTSGTGIFTVDSRGAAPAPDAKIYNDLDIAGIEALGTAHPQRKVHVKVIEAAEKGYLRSYIILPSTIFGISSLAGVSEIFNKHSNQLPALIRGSIKRKQAGLVGEYKNTWPLVHTDDLTDLYQRVFESALEGKDVGQGREGFYVAENGKYYGVEAAKAVGEALLNRKIADTAEPSTFSPEEMQKYYGAYANFAGTNSQALGDRSRRAGWAPRYDHADFIASIDKEVETIYQEEF